MSDDIGFPKPEPKPKSKPKRLPPVRKAGKRNFNAEQHEKRKQHEMLYRRVVRPQFLLDKAREQGRLRLPDDRLEGDTPQKRLRNLPFSQHPRCTVHAPGTGCTEASPNVATEVHHKAGRSRRKAEPHLLTDTTFFQETCPDCHRYIEANPEWASERGLKESRHDRVTTQDDYL